MSLVLDLDDLTYSAFTALYECLLEVHGESYANYICGDPDEGLYFDGYTIKELEKSLYSQTCVECGAHVSVQDVPECTFEGVEDIEGSPVGDDDCVLHTFYMCLKCQGE